MIEAGRDLALPLEAATEYRVDIGVQDLQRHPRAVGL